MIWNSTCSLSVMILFYIIHLWVWYAPLRQFEFTAELYTHFVDPYLRVFDQLASRQDRSSRYLRSTITRSTDPNFNSTSRAMTASETYTDKHPIILYVKLKTDFENWSWKLDAKLVWKFAHNWFVNWLHLGLGKTCFVHFIQKNRFETSFKIKTV